MTAKNTHPATDRAAHDAKPAHAPAVHLTKEQTAEKKAAIHAATEKHHEATAEAARVLHEIVTEFDVRYGIKKALTNAGVEDAEAEEMETDVKKAIKKWKDTGEALNKAVTA